MSDTISVDKDELRAIVKEYVQKKFAALTENRSVKEVSTFGRKAVQDEAMGGGVPGAIAPIGEGEMELTKTPADELDAPPDQSTFGKRKPRTPQPIDSEAARELFLYMQNDEETWDRRKPQYDKNLLRKVKKGVYNSEASAKLWLYLVDEAAKKYVQTMGSSGARVDSLFNLQTRKFVAAKLVEMFEEEHLQYDPTFIPENKGTP